MVSSFTVSVLETKRLSVLIVTSMFSAIICQVSTWCQRGVNGVNGVNGVEVSQVWRCKVSGCVKVSGFRFQV